MGLLDDEYEASALDREYDEAPPPPRMERRRRLVLGEGGVEEGARVELGGEYDADAPLPSVPAHADEKGPSRGFTADERARREVDEGTGPGALADAAAAAVPGVSAAWDTLGLLTTGEVSGQRAQARHGSRGRDFWDQITSGDDRLGGRNPLRPMVGRDERGSAPLVGAMDTLGIVAREPETRARMAAAREQAPEMTAVGAAAAMPAWMLAPNPTSAGGRLAMSTGVSGAAGGLHSAAQGNDGEQVAIDTLGGAGMGLLTAGLGEVFTGGVAAAGRARQASAATRAPRMRQAAESTQGLADQARLEASGFWGPRAIDQIDRAGGPGAVATDLRRFRIGQSAGERIPTMQRAASDLDSLGRGGSDTMGLIAETADETGVRIPTRAVLERAEQIAANLESRGSATATRAAERIRREVEPLAGRADMTPTQAWRLRQTYDQLADFGGRASDESAMMAGDQFRVLRRAIDSELDNGMEVAGMGPSWSEASRMSQLGIVSEEAGAGFRRLSAGGGMQGAMAGGDLVARAVESGNPLRMAASIPQTMIARAMGQEARMATPGVIAVGREMQAGRQRSAADTLYRIAREQPAQLGPYARAILEAGGRGAAALTTTIHVLSQRDPEARRVLEEAQGLDQQE